MKISLKTFAFSSFMFAFSIFPSFAEDLLGHKNIPDKILISTEKQSDGVYNVQLTILDENNNLFDKKFMKGFSKKIDFSNQKQENNDLSKDIELIKSWRSYLYLKGESPETMGVGQASIGESPETMDVGQASINDKNEIVVDYYIFHLTHYKDVETYIHRIIKPENNEVIEVDLVDMKG